MIQGKIRKQGNSFVVTIPRDEMEHYHLAEGDEIAFTPTRMETVPVLDPKLQKIAGDIFGEYKEVFEYLAER